MGLLDFLKTPRSDNPNRKASLEGRSQLYNLLDNIIGFEDDRVTPGEALGAGLRQDPMGVLSGVAQGVEGDLRNLMFEGQAMQRPFDVMGYAAVPMAPGARGLLSRSPDVMYSNPVMQPFDMGGSYGHNGGPSLRPTLQDALEARAGQMALKPVDRIQPSVGGAGVLDRDYMTPAPGGLMPDLSQYYPRNPDPAAALPKSDRARILVDRKDEIADRLADRIRATGQMDEDTRYFYHSDGPIYRAAKEAGLTDEEAGAYLRDLGNQVAATSPRTKVEENLRNATLSMAKEAQGIPIRDIIGPGTVDPKTGVRGISEKGYPMMTGKGGIHGKLLDDLAREGSLNVNTNPKPSNFGPNIAGNRSGVTVDTHAIRGTLQTLNEMKPGSVPEGFILPKYRAQYAADPLTLTPDMIDDSIGSQMVGPKGEATSMMTEYPVFADIWHGAADRLGVSPAEAQSMGWFGFGDDTNLGSARKTPIDIFDERLSVTAQALGVSPKEAARGVFRREIPLLGTAGLGLLGMSYPQEDQY